MDDDANKTKVRFKNQCTRFWNRCCLSAMYQFFLVEISFQSSDREELDFGGFVIRMFLNVKSQGSRKSSFSPRGPTTP